MNMDMRFAWCVYLLLILQQAWPVTVAAALALGWLGVAAGCSAFGLLVKPVRILRPFLSTI
jgi:hypothetical protein